MKKIIFCLITVFIFLPTFVEAKTVVLKEDDVMKLYEKQYNAKKYKTFEVKADNNKKYYIDCYSAINSPIYSVFIIKGLTVIDKVNCCEYIDYEKYSVEKIKNGFAILYDKAEKIKFIDDLEKRMWTIVLHGANSTNKYSVEFSIIKSNSQTLFNNICRWGARYGNSNNEKIFSNMKVSYNNEQYCDVPLTAYCDIANPWEYQLYPIIDGFVLKIEGGYGESGDSYIAKLTFKKGLLIRKEIKHGVFPDEAWEQTVYSYNEREDI